LQDENKEKRHHIVETLPFFVPFFAPLCVTEVLTFVSDADVGAQSDCPDEYQNDVYDFATVNRDVIHELDHHDVNQWG